MAYRHLFSPINIGPLKLKNRLAMTAHGTRFPWPRFLCYLEERARGGVGLIINSDVSAQGIISSSKPPVSFTPRRGVIFFILTSPPG